MPVIPPAIDTDTEDVTWALQTAEALWKRNERADALVWLRRAAQAAGEAEHDDRALELADDAAEIAEWIAAYPSAGVARVAPRTPTGPPAPGAFPEPDTTGANNLEELVDEETVEITLDSDTALPPLREPMDTPIESRPALDQPRVPSAAEKHAGMLDPWAEGDSRSLDVDHEAPTRPPPPMRSFDADEVVTSAPPMRHPASPDVGASPGAGISRAGSSPGARAVDLVNSVDLSEVTAFSDLPDDHRDAFARAAIVRDLTCNEEISGFALALILDGSVDLAATTVNTPAQRLEAGEVVRARGTLDHVAPLRLVTASESARVATWNEAAVDEAFRTCPWVEDDLRVAGDRLQALVGVTMGPLGERLDPVLRAQVASKLTLRALAEHEVFATRGKPVPGLFVVGAGELELVGDDGSPDGTVLRAGDFLFPHEVLRAGPAPSTVRASRGGALVLFADRHAAQELLVTCPPLLEIFADT
jgi:hypothetical protein